MEIDNYMYGLREFICVIFTSGSFVILIIVILKMNVFIVVLQGSLKAGFH